MRGCDELSAVVARVCADLGVSLYDLERMSGVVQVTVERAGGLDLDALAVVARALSAALDEAGDAVPDDHYELEVTTPGVERRLRRPAHFSAAVGGFVAVRTRPGVPGNRRVEGMLVASDDGGIVVTSGGAERRIGYDDVDRAHTVFDWRAALAGTGTPAGSEGSAGTATTRERATTS